MKNRVAYKKVYSKFLIKKCMHEGDRGGPRSNFSLTYVVALVMWEELFTESKKS